MPSIFTRSPRGGSVIKAIVAVVIVVLTVATIGGIPGGLAIDCALGLICGHDGGGGGGGGGGQRVKVGASCSSPANACGQTNLGTIVNNGNGTGSCSATPPPNSRCPKPTITSGTGFYADPSTIGSGDSSTLYWSAANATNCSIAGDNGFAFNGQPTGSTPTGSLTQTTTFTLTCEDGQGGPEVTANLKVLIDPHYREL